MACPLRFYPLFCKVFSHWTAPAFCKLLSFHLASLVGCWVQWFIRPAKNLLTSTGTLANLEGQLARLKQQLSVRSEERKQLHCLVPRAAVFGPFGVQESLRGSTEAAPFPGYALSGAPPPPAMRSRRPTLAEARAQQEMRGLGQLIIGRWCGESIPYELAWSYTKMTENVWISNTLKQYADMSIMLYTLYIIMRYFKTMTDNSRVLICLGGVGPLWRTSCCFCKELLSQLRCLDHGRVKLKESQHCYVFSCAHPEKMTTSY